MPSRMRRKPKPYHHGNLQETLVSAAVGLLRRGGPEALTLRALAHKAGVSATAPYRHFQGREGLVAAVAERGFVELQARMRETAGAAAPGASIERGLQEIGMTYVRFAIERPAEFRLMFGPLADRDRHQGLQRAADALFALLAGGIAELQRAGRVRAGDAGDVALSAWAMVHGVAMLALDGRVSAEAPAEIERIARAATDLLMTGMAPRSGAARLDDPPALNRQ